MRCEMLFTRCSRVSFSLQLSRLKPNKRCYISPQSLWQSMSLSMSNEALQQAQAEKLTLLVAETRSGYFGVAYRSNPNKPYQARVRRGGEQVSLGYFATAEEAALCVARSPEGQAIAAEWAAAPLTSEEAR